jgi:hypothetical protein
VLRNYRFLFSLLFLTLFEGSATAAGVSVLFVGNSLTQANDLTAIFKQLAANSSLHADVDVRSITPGGATLYDHWKRGVAVTMLRKQHVNFLILQAQSTEPLFAPESFNECATLFKSEADRAKTQTVLFSTWARPASDSFYKERSSGGSPMEMQTRLNAAYAALAQKTEATLAPVGMAWERAQKIAPEIQLLDGTQHPSRAGTYLAAAVLFHTIFNAPASGSTFYDDLPVTTAHTLQRVADSVLAGELR